MEGMEYWVWLAELPGLHKKNRLALLNYFGSPRAIYEANPWQLREVPGLSERQATLVENRNLSRAREICEACEGKDIFILTYHDTLYPERLRVIKDAPVLLYARGKLPRFDDEAAVAVVGTRSCTPGGARVAQEFGYGLAVQGGLVVSGLAAGIDTAALFYALRAGGVTAAVLGCGIDVVYPVSNAPLYEAIMKEGVILSEYPPGTQGARWRFPERNRIISGLSIATVVIEAPERSGALITARNALEQGRDLYAVPGGALAPESRGSNALLSRGVRAVVSAWDVLGRYESRFPHRLQRRDGIRTPANYDRGFFAPRWEGEIKAPALAKKQAPRKSVSPAPPREVPRQEKNTDGLTALQLRVVESLRGGELLTDDLGAAVGASMDELLPALTLLEVTGWVRRTKSCGYELSK